MMRVASLVGASVIAAFSSAVAAQSYPDKPVRLVIGFAAGGPTDLPARFVADRLGNALGQRFVVENRAGASGQIATNDVLSKPRDGYNLLLCTHFEGINLALHKAATYKLSDIAPISQISRYYYGLAVTNAIPPADWKSFIAYAKANPGKVNYGTIGRGSAQELLALEIGKLTGTTLTGVPYKGGPDVINDLIAGRIDLYVSPTLAVLPQQKAGKLKVIAVTSAERLAAAPDVPTVSENGLPLVRFGWLGVCAAAGTPQPIIATLNRQIGTIVRSGDYREMIEKTGSVPLASTPEELGKILADTYEQTANIVREFNLQQE
jgi:tripartite-type tricarboxylate transporter receptor subunit TctC